MNHFESLYRSISQWPKQWISPEAQFNSDAFSYQLPKSTEGKNLLINWQESVSFEYVLMVLFFYVDFLFHEFHIQILFLKIFRNLFDDRNDKRFLDQDR